MSSQQDALRAGRGDSLGRRPAAAQATAAPASTLGQQFDGRRSMGNGFKLRIDRIEADPTQPRKTFTAEAMNRLARSMETQGQFVPILVRWDVALGKYVVIDGERRYRAALMTKMTELAVVVEDEADPATILEMQLITNALREGVDPIEQAHAIERLRTSGNMTFRELGEKLGIDHSSIGKMLDLLKLDQAVQDQVQAGTIPASTATTMVRLDPIEQRAVADRVVGENLSRAETTEVVRQFTRERSPAKGKGRGAKSKGKAPSAWKHRADGGGRMTVERAKGIDDGALLDFLRSAVAAMEAKLTTAPAE